jgi:hypothetical protein
MKKAFAALLIVILYSGVSLAQRGTVEPDYYPLGYAGDTWTGEVTAVDNEQRTLTLTYGKDKLTFIATIPDAPYEWRRNKRQERVLDFPYDPKAKSQTYKYEGPSGGVALLLPEGDEGGGMKRVPNPPDSNRITDLSDFVGRTITVYYTARERNEPTGNRKYNDVWRVKVLGKKK